MLNRYQAVCFATILAGTLIGHTSSALGQYDPPGYHNGNVDGPSNDGSGDRNSDDSRNSSDNSFGQRSPSLRRDIDRYLGLITDLANVTKSIKDRQRTPQEQRHYNQATEYLGEAKGAIDRADEAWQDGRHDAAVLQTHNAWQNATFAVEELNKLKRRQRSSPPTSSADGRKPGFFMTGSKIHYSNGGQYCWVPNMTMYSQRARTSVPPKTQIANPSRTLTYTGYCR